MYPTEILGGVYHKLHKAVRFRPKIEGRRQGILSQDALV